MKYAIVGMPHIGTTVARHIAESKDTVLIVASEEKERGITIINEPEPFIITNPYPLGQIIYPMIFDEPKNFINGKKQPRKKYKK